MEQVGAIFDEAYSLFQNKSYDRSLAKISEAEKIIEDSSQKAEADVISSMENFKGFNYLALNRLQEARVSFEKSLSVNPNSSQACAGLGEIFFILEMDYEAKVMYEWSLEYNPDNKLAEAGLAKSNKNLGLDSEHRTLENNIASGNTFYSRLAEAYKTFNNKDFGKTLEILDSISEPKNPDPHSMSSLLNFKGFTLLALDRKEDARECFESALDLNSESSQACSGLAELFYLEGEMKNAKTMYEWGVKYNPSNMFAVKGLAKVNSEMHMPETHSSIA